MTTPSALAAYYAARANEYEQIYTRPERQRDLRCLRDSVVSFSSGRRVLEIACGTGYWTAVMAERAISVLATDIGEEVLDVARAKDLRRVTFLAADAFALGRIPGEFDAAFAGFWWSHIRRRDVRRFLVNLHQRLGFGAHVMLLDNRYVAGSSTPICHTDSAGDTYQRRTLSDGSEHEVLKNFPATSDVDESITLAGGTSIDVRELDYYWSASYVVGAPPNEEL